MKKFVHFWIFSSALLLLSSCSKVIGEARPLEGYWRGFIQVKSEVLKEKQSPNNFGDAPINIYCKIEQTGDVFLGQYSTKFDADAFKKEVPKDSQKVEGVISGRGAIIRLHNVADNGFYTPIEAKVLISNGELSGEWKMEYKWNGSLYFGVIKLKKY